MADTLPPPALPLSIVNSSPENKMSAGALAGIIVGSVVGGLTALFSVMCAAQSCARRPRRLRSRGD